MGVVRIMNKDDVKVTEADFFKNVPADQSQSVFEVYRVKVKIQSLSVNN